MKFTTTISHKKTKCVLMGGPFTGKRISLFDVSSGTLPFMGGRYVRAKRGRYDPSGVCLEWESGKKQQEND